VQAASHIVTRGTTRSDNVIEGSYEFGINGEPPRTLKAGDTFYEPPSALHSISRNPSADQRLKIVAFMVADQKNPSTVSE
jgi:quercetin dioxygenase-like cupin family protein